MKVLFPNIVGRDQHAFFLGVVEKYAKIKQQTYDKVSVYAESVKQKNVCVVFSIELLKNSKVVL